MEFSGVERNIAVRVELIMMRRHGGSNVQCLLLPRPHTLLESVCVRAFKGAQHRCVWRRRGERRERCFFCFFLFAPPVTPCSPFAPPVSPCSPFPFFFFGGVSFLSVFYLSTNHLRGPEYHASCPPHNDNLPQVRRVLKGWTGSGLWYYTPL